MKNEYVNFTYQNQTYQMTKEQIEAAYRYQERQYKIEDAKRHLLNALNEDAEDFNDFTIEDVETFRKRYGVDLEDAIANLDYLVEWYESNFDCNLTENDMWAEAVSNYLPELKNNKKNMKFSVGTEYGSGCEYFTKEDFLNEMSLMIDDCRDNGGTCFDVVVYADASCYQTQP